MVVVSERARSQHGLDWSFAISGFSLALRNNEGNGHSAWSPFYCALVLMLERLGRRI